MRKRSSSVLTTDLKRYENSTSKMKRQTLIKFVNSSLKCSIFLKATSATEWRTATVTQQLHSNVTKIGPCVHLISPKSTWSQKPSPTSQATMTTFWSTRTTSARVPLNSKRRKRRLPRPLQTLWLREIITIAEPIFSSIHLPAFTWTSANKVDCSDANSWL